MRHMAILAPFHCFGLALFSPLPAVLSSYSGIGLLLCLKCTLCFLHHQSRIVSNFCPVANSQMTSSSAEHKNSAKFQNSSTTLSFFCLRVPFPIPWTCFSCHIRFLPFIFTFLFARIFSHFVNLGAGIIPPPFLLPASPLLMNSAPAVGGPISGKSSQLPTANKRKQPGRHQRLLPPTANLRGRRGQAPEEARKSITLSIDGMA
jgi:hypothetical protein